MKQGSHEAFLLSSAGIVRMEQKNNTLLEMGVYDDGPYEVGDENLLNPELVPLPANSYLGERLPTKSSCFCLHPKYTTLPHYFHCGFWY